MKYISRNHRVNLGWLFDRIKPESCNPKQHVNTSKQIADLLTKRLFSRERWSQLTHLFNLTT